MFRHCSDFSYVYDKDIECGHCVVCVFEYLEFVKFVCNNLSMCTLCVCVRVCVCVCVCVHTCTRLHVCMHVCVYTKGVIWLPFCNHVQLSVKGSSSFTSCYGYFLSLLLTKLKSMYFGNSHKPTIYLCKGMFTSQTTKLIFLLV